VYFAHANTVTMDEGTYLVKGLLFARGEYTPFQAYGPWTNKMPLSFLIPGWVQVLFGPGLRTGRYFSIFLGALMLVGVWLTARRLTGSWPAAAAVWVFALTPGNTMIYSLAISQALVACMLAWTLYFSLGAGRAIWQTTLAAILAALIVLTRQNMLPVPFLLVAYIFWQHGRRAGAWALAAAALTLAVLHGLYWPNIMRIWAAMFPKALTPFLNPWRPDLGIASIHRFEYGLLTRLFVFWEGIRFNFFALVGAALAWLLWPQRRGWKSVAAFRSSVLLSALLVVLAGAHLYASLGQAYCVYCYTVYLPFFSLAGVLLVLVSYPSWVRRPGGWRSLALALAVILVSAGVGFGGWQALHAGLLNLQVPRMREMRILPGSTELWRTLANRFGWSYEMMQQLLPALAGLAFGLALLAVFGLAAWGLARTGRRAWPAGRAAALALLVLGSLLSPLRLLSGTSLPNDCGLDVIATHEAQGEYLRGVIPAGSLVYWQNDRSPLPLLYLNSVRLFPAQLNHWYSFQEGGDPAELVKYGFWNAQLSEQWLQEADFLLVAERYIENFEANSSLSGKFDELVASPPTLPCEGRSVIHIFRRVP